MSHWARRLTIPQTAEFAARIGECLDFTRQRGAPTMASVDELSARASGLIDRLRSETPDVIAAQLQVDPVAPDLANALVDALGRDLLQASAATLGDVGHIYELLILLDWDDEIGERQDLLARLSFLAWNQARLLVAYETSRQWQSRCVKHTLAQEQLRNFFSLSAAERSSELNDRFLADDSVLLSACGQLAQERNRNLARVMNEGEALYTWLAARADAQGSNGDRFHYLAADVAIMVLGAAQLRRRGPGDDSFERIRSHIRRCKGSEPLAAKLEHTILITLYRADKEAAGSVDSCRELVERFEALGMLESALFSRYLLGLLLKEVGDRDEALSILLDAHSRAVEIAEPLVPSLSLATIAQILAERDGIVAGLAKGLEALRLGARSGFEEVVGYAQASVAEMLRDCGSLASSIQAYRASAQSMTTAGHFDQAAYVRILLSEVLLMAGRPSEAVEEILLALPVVEQGNLAREAIAAVALLREAVRCQQTDPLALRQLREQLQLMRREGKL